MLRVVASHAHPAEDWFNNTGLKCTFTPGLDERMKQETKTALISDTGMHNKAPPKVSALI